MIHRHGTSAGFTLLELLAALAVLGVLGTIVGQMLGGSLRAVQISRAQMDTCRGTRALSDALESDLRLVTARAISGGQLGLSLEENDDVVRLGLSFPDLKVRSVEQYGTVAQVIYRWDKKGKALQRVEFHSARDPELVAATGADANGANASSNELRRRRLSPAYAAGSLSAWMDDPLLVAEQKRSSSTPLLQAVADFEVVCYSDRTLQRAESRNTWNRVDRLPAALRIRARFAPTTALASRRDAPGVRYFDVYVPLSQYAP